MSEVNVERLSQYSEEDAVQLGQLMTHLSKNFSGEPIDPDVLKTIIESPYHDQLVARLQGRIVGAATLSLVMGVAAGKKGYLEDFVTDPNVQRQGIGSKVWDEMMEWCREQGVNLDFTSKESRVAAHQFYDSRGATVRDTTAFRVEVD